MEKQKSALDKDITSITSLLEQTETRGLDLNGRAFYTIGVMQGFLTILNTPSHFSDSQRKQINEMLETWDEAIWQRSNPTQESEG